jgi:predicted ArsR family transcriptional regulator
MNLRKTSVPLQVVETAITLYDYVLECYGILNSNIGVTLMQDVMREIQRHIIRHQKQTSRGASARDIARYTARRNYSLEQIKKALEVMTALDIIELEPKQSKMGRPTARYLVVGES